jgi:hypothetical protein
MGMGTHLSCFNISWKQCKCIVCPHRRTDVSLSESNMYCLAVTVLVVNGRFSESSSGVGRGKDRETRQAHETNLVADGAVVFHGVLDAAVLLVAQCEDGCGHEESNRNMRKGLLTALVAVEEVVFSSDSVAVQQATIVRSCIRYGEGKRRCHNLCNGSAPCQPTQQQHLSSAN